MKLSKKVLLAASNVCVKDKTIHTQKQADVEEQNFQRILYTDASVIRLSNPPGKAATGYIWYQKTPDDTWEELSRGTANIGSGHSSYSAEAIAIREGLENNPHPTATITTCETAEEAAEGGIAPDAADGTRMTARNDTNNITQEIGVFTDSLSNLVTIKKGIAETPEQEELLRKIAEFPYKITFHHVKSHQDNAKNIAVDKLCNANTNTPERKNANKLGGKNTETKIKNWMKDWASNRRRENLVKDKKAIKRGSVTQKWMKRCLTDKGKLIPRPKIHNELPRRKGVLLAKVRTNRYTQCNWYLHFIKQRKSPLCRACTVNDTTEHVINECQIHEDPRSLLLQNLRHSGKVSDLLNSREKIIVDELANYLIKVDDERKRRGKEEEEAEELAEQRAC